MTDRAACPSNLLLARGSAVKVSKEPSGSRRSGRSPITS